MNPYFQHNSQLNEFRLFSSEHLWTIVIILFLSILLFIMKKQVRLRRKSIRFFLAGFLLISMLSHQLWLVQEGAWKAKSSLPLHLSDLAVILAIVMLITKSTKLFQFMFFAGIASSVQAILTPDLGKYSFPHFQYIVFFLTHGGVIIACLFMLLAYHLRPTWSSLWVSVLIVNGYAVCIYFLNKLLDSNYLYIKKKPDNASLLDALGEWPMYLFWMELIMIASFLFLYVLYKLKKITSSGR
ncbi:TIGR02206 family membrane protein [Metabacillus idriensis]|uniref:YwaF family protein n=1 Tax=Metabacillus idriensis TaxID=324768 RepID=UPI00174BFD3D|nr:TIGR02206 family membrane protein [Metabacillus idriensis]